MFVVAGLSKMTSPLVFGGLIVVFWGMGLCIWLGYIKSKEVYVKRVFRVACCLKCEKIAPSYFRFCPDCGTKIKDTEVEVEIAT